MGAAVQTREVIFICRSSFLNTYFAHYWRRHDASIPHSKSHRAYIAGENSKPPLTCFCFPLQLKVVLKTETYAGSESLVLAAAQGRNTAIYTKTVGLLGGEVRPWHGFGMFVLPVPTYRVLLGAGKR